MSFFCRAFILLVFILLSILGLQGCVEEDVVPPDSTIEIDTMLEENDSAASQKDVVLRIITEQSAPYGFNNQMQTAKESFERMHNNVSVEVIVLPVEAEARDDLITQLQSQQEYGNGPDVYLLPTGKYVDAISGNYIWEEVTPVFSNVSQSMKEGVFADISEFYDEDSTINKDSLNQKIMNAGVMDDGRYVLPLRYDVPVIYADLEQLAEIGLTSEDIDVSVIDLMDLAIQCENEELAYSVLRLPQEQYMFPYTEDGSSDGFFEVRKSVAEKKYLLEIMSKDFSEHEDFIYPNALFHTYLSDGSFWCLDGYPIYLDTLRTSLENTALFARLGRSVAMLPLKSVANSWIASITYFGAVDAKSQNIQLSYEFLHLFLTEEYQWGKNVELAYSNSCLIHNSWPVLSDGSVVPLWTRLQGFFEECSAAGDIRKSLAKAFLDEIITITDEDIPILQTEPDVVIFPIVNS